MSTAEFLDRITEKILRMRGVASVVVANGRRMDVTFTDDRTVTLLVEEGPWDG